jgi:hypothetical protein
MHNPPSPLVSPIARATLVDAIRWRNASFALEGLQPIPEMLAVEAAVLAGRTTYEQVEAELVPYVQQHGSIKGFVETRAWAR